MHGAFHAFELLIFARRPSHPFLEFAQKIIAIIGSRLGRPAGNVGVQRIGRNHGDRLHHRKVEAFRPLRLETRAVHPSEEGVVDEGDEKHHEEMMLAKRDGGGRGALPVVAHQRFQERPAAQPHFRLQVHLRDQVVAAVNIKREMLRHPTIGDGMLVPADKALPPENQHGVTRLQHPRLAINEIMPAPFQTDDEVVHLVGFVDLPGARMLHLDRCARQVEVERRRWNGR